MLKKDIIHRGNNWWVSAIRGRVTRVSRIRLRISKRTYRRDLRVHN
jgi:hypothetical protein